MKRLVTEGAASDATASTLARDRVRARRQARRRRRAMGVVAFVLSIAVTAAAVYLAGFSYFKSHYYIGTQIAGVDASCKTEDELVRAIEARTRDYAIVVINGEYRFDVQGAPVGLTCDAAQAARDAMSMQASKRWPIEMIMGVQTPEITYTFDYAKLTPIVSEAVHEYNKTAKKPISAELVLNEARDAFSLKADEKGTVIDEVLVSKAIAEAMTRGAQYVGLSEDVIVQPAIRADSAYAQASLAQANKLLTEGIALARSNKTITSIPAKTLAQWLVVQGNMRLDIDKEPAEVWSEENVWEYADYADDKNVFSVNPHAFAEALSSAVRTVSDDTVQIPYVMTPRYMPGGGKLAKTPWNASMGRYIDVDKKNQVACLYDDMGRVLWETPVTTGNEASKDGTPVGKYAIYDKKTDFTLLGLDKNNDGKPDYEHHVDFWMPFNGLIGLHDASWRKVYGGVEYLERGSGGCVNLPKEAAKALFAITHENETVFVHE